MFLNEKSSFPPTQSTQFWDLKYREWSAWYSGDPQMLLSFYTIVAAGTGTNEERFWARIEEEERAGIVHLPAAGDISETSANLLFSEQPKYKYNEEGKAGERIKDFISENGFDNILLEGAELAAALSGCILKLDMDKDLSKLPIVSVLTPLQFYPTFRRGRLSEVLFFREVKANNAGMVWRLFENRRIENNSLIIEYQLHKGTCDKVGKIVPFDSIEETANIDYSPVIYNTPILGCVYIPNKKPNKFEPGSSLGINDYSGCITLMDSLDFAWTSLLRDIELGMSQVFIDEELLTRDKVTTSGETVYTNRFSKFAKSFINLNLTSWKMGGESGAKAIDMCQFNIRVDEHLKAIKELFINIVSNSGYSPQTFGLGDFGSAESGTALRIRENKSQLTRNKKARYWQSAIESILFQMQLFDVATGLSSSYTPEKVNVEIEDSIIVDTKETSEILRNLKDAEAISNFTKIKMLHPEWDNEKIEEEVKRIIDESGLTSNLFDNNV
jgi:A118 family predicted phage portal protein